MGTLKKNIRNEIPRKAIYRLSVYYRCLLRLKKNGIRTVSSDALANAAGVKPTQLRKDLTYFGQFGTRAMGGADAASARYIFTRLAPVVPLLFPEADAPVLEPRVEDGEKVEPEHFAPLLPRSEFVLVELRKPLGLVIEETDAHGGAIAVTGALPGFSAIGREIGRAHV